MATDADILTSIDNAILSIVGGTAASYVIGGRTYTALDLDQLQKMKSFYEARIYRAGGGAFSVARTVNPR